MSDDSKPEPYRPPPNPYGGKMSDAEFQRRKKEWNKYNREYYAREDARKERVERAKSPEQRAKEAEDRAIQRADQWSFDQEVQDATGMSIAEIRELFAEADDLTAGEKAAWELMQQADNAWTKGGRQRKQEKAVKKIKANKNSIKKRKKSTCSLFAIFILSVSVVEFSAFIQGVRDLASSLGWT